MTKRQFGVMLAVVGGVLTSTACAQEAEFKVPDGCVVSPQNEKAEGEAGCEVWDHLLEELPVLLQGVVHATFPGLDLLPSPLVALDVLPGILDVPGLVQRARLGPGDGRKQSEDGDSTAEGAPWKEAVNASEVRHRPWSPGLSCCPRATSPSPTCGRAARARCSRSSQLRPRLPSSRQAMRLNRRQCLARRWFPPRRLLPSRPVERSGRSHRVPRSVVLGGAGGHWERP